MSLQKDSDWVKNAPFLDSNRPLFKISTLLRRYASTGGRFKPNSVADLTEICNTDTEQI